MLNKLVAAEERIEKLEAEVAAVTRERDQAREALARAFANLKHVAVFPEADDDDPDAAKARTAWQQDLDFISAALSASGGADA